MRQKGKLNILISAYFCDPEKGSEAGVGWNFPFNMAKHHKVWVLTRKENQKSIEKYLENKPLKNLSFIYFNIPQKGILNEQVFGEQIFYIIWQICVIAKYKRISKKINFDLIHHLTFNQYRTPSIGYIVNKPFIAGPIGGAEKISPVFFKDLEISTKVKEYWRILGIDRCFFWILARLRNSPKTFIFSSKQNYIRLKNYVRKRHKSVIIPAIGINISDFDFELKTKKNLLEPFTIIYAGSAKDWKGLSLFLLAVKMAFQNQENVIIKLIGIRNKIESKKVYDLVVKNSIIEKVMIIDFMPRDKLIQEMTIADLSVYPAFRDSGSMSVLESCALGCPVLCFDAGGQDVFPADIVMKIPVNNNSYDDNVISLSNKLKWSFKNRDSLYRIGINAKQYAFEHFTWEKKVETFCDLYLELLLQK
jgi:glycosyltransferase involved in cell wall biosynthesis